MVDSDVENIDQPIDDDFFVIIKNNDDEEGLYDFVSIDEDLRESVVIDMSEEDPDNSFIIEVELDTHPDAFVTIDEDQIYLSDFTEDDIWDHWTDLDLPEEKINL